MPLRPGHDTVVRHGRPLLIGLASAGCGTGTAGPGEPPAGQIALHEVGEMYQMYLNEFKRPPSKEADLDKYAAGFSFGSLGVQRGDIVVFWDAPASDPSAAARTVLAFEKKTPKDGGGVLMQDGTVKTMTPDEFSGAPKAGKPATRPG